MFNRPLFFPLLMSLLISPGLSGQEMNITEFQQWLTRQTDYKDGLSMLYEILGTRISAPPPRGRLAEPFLALGRSLDNTVPVFHNAMMATPDWNNATAATDLSTIYRYYFPEQSTCPAQTLPLPATLEEAAGQIRTLAADVMHRQLHLLQDEQLAFVRAFYPHMSYLLLNAPWGGGIPESDLPNVIRFYDILDLVSRDNLFCTAQTWGQLLAPVWLTNLEQLMTASPEAASKTIYQEMTPFGLIRFGGRSNNIVLSGNMLFIADLDGDDIYALRTADPWSGIPQFIVDFGGDDIYESQEPGGYAAGIGSMAYLLDMEGDDTYKAESLSQGFGLMGVGLLLDRAGNDTYNGFALAQGAGIHGAGMLLDNQGNDHYQLRGLGQGLGMTLGLGILSDTSGDDTYLATGLTPTNYGTPGLSDTWSQGTGVGMRFIAPGGVGILEDGDGQDDYDAGSFSQGGGYFYGLGLQFDGGSHPDHYLGSRYNFGWASHAGLGYFLEEGGNDYYKTRQYVASGLSWDTSVVLFEDLAGDDYHEADGFSLGASAHRSIVIFHDLDGSDTYQGNLPALPTQGEPNLSIFLDEGKGSNTVRDLPETAACTVNDAFGLGFFFQVTELSLKDVAACTSSPSS